jgi:hypothetical protein
MAEKVTDGNLRIAVKKTENGEIVYHRYPNDLEYDAPTAKTHKNSFEWDRDPHFEKYDNRRCLHYHLGYVIDEYVAWALDHRSDYEIEIVIKKKDDEQAEA